jgi:HK97 gp10 family phage protein
MSIGKRQGVTIRGLEDLEKKLRKLPELVQTAGGRAVKAEAEETRDDMKRGAPVDTGDLRDHIQAEYDSKTITGRAVATSKHAGFVEHGTDDTPAQPFAQPAAERARRRFPDRVRREIKAELGKL